MSLDKRIRILGVVLQRATGPVEHLTADKRTALRRQRAPRVVTDYLNGKRAKGVATVDMTVEGAGGPLPARVYRPAAPRVTSPLPLVVVFHGGGWMFGNIDSADWLCSHLASRLGAVVVSGTYRLAPEHPVPAAMQDALAVTQWAVRNGATLGADPDRLAVIGESSGACLAASVTLVARDLGAFPIRSQVLLYPITDLSLSGASIKSQSGEPILTSNDLRAYVSAYLGGHGDPWHPRVSPLHATSHSGLPPALVVGAEHDPLRDDARRYAARLRASGVAVSLVEVGGAPHGFFSFPNICRMAGPTLDEVVGYLRGLLCVE